jgi:hypothetical protein
MAATSFGTATVSDGSKASRLKDLLEAAPERQLHDMLYRSFLAQILPGIQTAIGDDEEPVSIYQDVTDRDRKIAIAGRRLASPDHYRLYFSLIGPTHAVPQETYDRFWSALDRDAADAAAILLALHDEKSFGSLRKSDVLFERLRGADPKIWTGVRPRNLLLAQGQIMDDILRQGASSRNIITTTSDRAERLVPILFARLEPGDRSHAIDELFGGSPAISWLTLLIRTETFAHGRHGSRQRPESEWFLTEVEFDQAAALMLSRYRQMSSDDILAVPRPLTLLFAWNQLGDTAGPRDLIAGATVSDAQFLTFLTRLTSRIESSVGRHLVLKRDNIDPFLDYDAMRKRLDKIAAGPDAAEAAAARELIAAAEEAKNW